MGPPPRFSVSHLQRFHREPGFQPLEILLSNNMPRGSAFSLSPHPLTIHESGACESADAQDGLSSELDTCGQCQGEGFGACLPRFLGTCPVLPLSLPQVPGFLPAKNATPFPSHCIFLAQLRYQPLSHKACEPSYPHPYSEICLFLLCIPLAPYLFFSGDKFCLVLAFS